MEVAARKSRRRLSEWLARAPSPWLEPSVRAHPSDPESSGAGAADVSAAATTRSWLKAFRSRFIREYARIAERSSIFDFMSLVDKGYRECRGSASDRDAA